jgi:hypothetical protein
VPGGSQSIQTRSDDPFPVDDAEVTT